MTLLQKIIYIYLNNLAKITFWVFFRRITILNKEHIPKNTPTLLAPNHPNTMVDPILMARISPSWIHFLANYGLFKKPLTKFLMTKIFFSIPVKRPKDVAPGEMINNLTTIKLCSQVLAKKGTIFMGPEATSYTYRRIRPLKDGIARIALTAAKRGKFSSGLVIIPFGTNYSSPTHFRSEIIMNIGEPIQVDSFKDLYKKNKTEAAQAIMDTLRTRLENLSVHTEDEIENQLLIWCETIAKTEKKYNSFSSKLEYDLNTIPILQELRVNNPLEFESLWRLCYSYFSPLKQENITDEIFFRYQEKNKSSFHLLFIIGFILFTPIYLIGCLLNFIWFFPKFIFDQLNLYEGYTSMVKILTGLIFIPIFYAIIFSIIGFSFGLKWLFIYILITFLTGLAILPYHDFIELWKMKLKATVIKDKEKLLTLRNQILNSFQEQNLI